MKRFFWTLSGDLLSCFKGRMLVWDAVAIALTVILENLPGPFRPGASH
jgi:hypothetical protein